ncbi:carbohydrate ABC transporter permease [Chelativorans salis]|uniref:Sugar ABC transporter permease n=1 Tax=Chelativorans salis TaxID=2978478 RepID=A0ABT2LVT6_9HYPH|nr:sugar ABC transporter permease [Chelativorans sp. EGI FJ00035]MCT7378637.1 sugar ABC transporter permease [Chelativorans sp. EGI FJ00035]
MTQDKLMMERRMKSRAWWRQRVNFVIFLGPAILLTVFFFVVPVLIDIAVSFTDLGRSLRVTRFTTEHYERVFGGDRRLTDVMALTFIYVLGTLALFNVTFGLVLALITTSIDKVSGGFFRGVWLLPRMSPSVLYILLWVWVVNPSQYGLLNQILMTVFGLEQPLDLLTTAPIALIIISNGFIGASMGMIIFTSAIRGIPEHLFHAARVDGAGSLAIVWYITLPALRWPISFITIYQALSLLVSFEYILLLTKGGPFYDTTVYALYIYRRAFQSGQYGYGAALSLFLIVIGIAVALLGWRFFDMKRLLQNPRIEVQ